MNYLIKKSKVLLEQQAMIKDILPSGFTKLEYLEGSGTQYIDTGQVFKNTDEMLATAAITDNNNDKYFVAPSKWNDKGSNKFSLGGRMQNVFTCAYGNIGTSSTSYLPVTPINIEKHIYRYSNKKFFIDDMNLSKNVSTINWAGDTTNLYLFYGYNSPAKCKIYSYIHYRDGQEIMNLIPCLDTNNTPCMYDAVSKKTFYNRGGGEFLYNTKGAV